MTMLDLMPVQDWLALERELFDQFHINAQAVDASGKPVTPTRLWCNRLCQAVRENPEGALAICAPSGQEFTRRIREERRPILDECELGLAKVLVPVIVNGELVGGLGGCGPLPQGQEPETFLAQASLGLTEDQTAALARTVPVVPRERLETMRDAIAARVAAIVARAEAAGA